MDDDTIQEIDGEQEKVSAVILHEISPDLDIGRQVGLQYGNEALWAIQRRTRGRPKILTNRRCKSHNLQ